MQKDLHRAVVYWDLPSTVEESPAVRPGMLKQLQTTMRDDVEKLRGAFEYAINRRLPRQKV